MATVSHDGDFHNTSNGNWGLARVFHRDNPWTPRQWSRANQPASVTYTTPLRDGTGVDMYILDGGVLTTHDEFGTVNQLAVGLNLDGNGENPGANEHGTGVASCAAGSTVGVAPGVNLFSAKALNEAGSVTSSNFTTVLQAIESHQSGRSNPFVVNMSLSGFTSTANHETEIDDLVEAGGVLVMAAGNGFTDTDTDANGFPQRYNDVFVVAASDWSDHMYLRSQRSDDTGLGTAGSDYGELIDAFAPGTLMKVATSTGISNYRISTGTSYSAPLVAGLFALILQGQSKPANRAAVQSIIASFKTNNLVDRRVKLASDAVADTIDSMAYFDPSTAV